MYIMEDKLQIFINSFIDGIALLDKELNLISNNLNFEKIMRNILLGNSLVDNPNQFYWEEIKKKAKMNQKIFKYQFEISSEFSLRHFELTLNPCPKIENIAFIALIKDVTVQRQRFLEQNEFQDMLIQKIEKKDKTLSELSVNLKKESAERLQAEQDLEFLAYHDQLTSLTNRLSAKKFFVEKILFENEDKPVAFLFMDLTKFKLVNDTLGHHIGDELLVQLSKRLYDFIGKKGIVSRFGGDEFLIMYTDFISKSELPDICEEIIRKVAEEFLVFDHKLNIETSIGITVYPDDGSDFNTLVQEADTAMYVAKELGPSTAQFYSTEMSLDLYEQLTISNWLKHAPEKNELILFYQPKLELRSNIVNSCEGLIRWKNPIKGLVPPLKFIPIAEQTGIISKIGNWVLKEACREILNWKKENIYMKIAVNLSPYQFNRGNIHKEIKEILEEFKINPELLELEITESGMMRDIQSAIKTMHLFRDIGVTITLDDFGTGYSSLSYLKELPIHNLKIDKSFLNSVPEDNKESSIVKTIIDMSKSLGLYVIAEGVERIEQQEFLYENGCDAIQGYLLSKPKPIQEFKETDSLKKHFVKPFIEPKYKKIVS